MGALIYYIFNSPDWSYFKPSGKHEEISYVTDSNNGTRHNSNRYWISTTKQPLANLSNLCKPHCNTFYWNCVGDWFFYYQEKKIEQFLNSLIFLKTPSKVIQLTLPRRLWRRIRAVDFYVMGGQNNCDYTTLQKEET